MIRGYYKTYWERIHGQDHMPQIDPLLGNAKLNCNYALSSKKKRNDQNSQKSLVLPANIHVYSMFKRINVLKK